jgi:hypothetical protein
MIYKFPSRRKRQNSHSSVPVVSPTASDSSSSSSLTLKTIVQNIYHRRTAHNNNKSIEPEPKGENCKEDERHDSTMKEDDSKEELPPTEDHEDAEQREPVVKTHRRTSATDWNELVHRAQHPHRQHHRRTFAMTNDEFMDVTMVCDELHGASLCMV